LQWIRARHCRGISILITLSPFESSIDVQFISLLSLTHDGAAEVLAIHDSIGGIKAGSGGLATEPSKLLGEASELLREASSELLRVAAAKSSHKGLLGHNGGSLHVLGLALDDASSESSKLGATGLHDGAALEAAINDTVSSVEGQCVAPWPNC